MTDCLVETTVFTNFLLKRDGSEKIAQKAISTYAKAYVAEYTIKEFKRGPLQNFFWMYQKFEETRSFSKALLALQKLSATPHRYKTSTAIQALQSVTEIAKDYDLTSLQAAYGNEQSVDVVFADFMRLEIKQMIFNAWKNRGEVGEIIDRLGCYPNEDIKLKDNKFTLKPNNCPKGTDCCLRGRLVDMKEQISELRDVLREMPDRREISRRRQVLKQLENKPKDKLGPDGCRDLGDAYFVLFCPENCEILTTNERDIKPMSDRLGVVMTIPS